MIKIKENMIDYEVNSEIIDEMVYEIYLESITIN